MAAMDGDHIQIAISSFDLGSLLASFDGYPDFRAELQSAEVLIIPSFLDPEYDGPVFPGTTSQVFRMLKNGLDGQAVVDAAIRDEDYLEFEFLSADIIFPAIFVAKEAFLPLIINILASYLYAHISSRERRVAAQVKSEIHFDTEQGRRLHIKYEGPADQFERIALKSIEEVSSYSKED